MKRVAPAPQIPAHAHGAARAGALFAISHSGGKDSQAMTLEIAGFVPIRQIVAFHAPLGEEEWPGTIEHIEATLPDGVPLVLAHTARGVSLLERVRERGMWPDKARRWCTSDFKRTPIEREIRRRLKAHPQYGNLVVSCMGMRADEGWDRQFALPWCHRPLLSLEGRRAPGRTWMEWRPLHAWTRERVFERIAAGGQQPFWIYAAGMSRMSCSFCIMSSLGDLRTAARLRPALCARYQALEAEIGHTLSPSRRTLREIVGDAANLGAAPAPPPTHPAAGAHPEPRP